MAAPAIATYAFEDVLCLVDGAPATGFTDDADALRIGRDVDTYSKLVGGQGDIALLKSADKSGVAILKLMQTSAFNAFLTTKLKLQDGGEPSPFGFSVKDLNSGDLIIAEQAVVVRAPDVIYGAGHNGREWSLLLPAVDIFANGVV